MSFLQRKIRFEEYFKDGNILEGREFKPGEMVVVSESDAQKIAQSGGVITDFGGVIPNPKKQQSEEPSEAAPASSGKKNDSKAKN